MIERAPDHEQFPLFPLTCHEHPQLRMSHAQAHDHLRDEHSELYNRLRAVRITPMADVIDLPPSAVREGEPGN